MKKLDELMKRNIPDTSEPLRPLTLPEKEYNWMKGFALSATVVMVITITFTQNRRYQEQTESLAALNEVMSWDLAEEETISEVEEVMEMIE